MGSIFRIGAALVCGTVIVGAASLAKQGEGTRANAAAIVVGTYEKTYRQTTDSDGDGMRDWEEELRGTDPKNPDDWSSVPLAEAEQASSSTGTYKPPTTLTGRFAQSFFEDYVRTGGGQGLDEAASSALVNTSISSLAKEVQPDFYTRLDIVIDQNNDMDSVRTYGNEAAKIIVGNTLVKEESPLLILHRALQEEDRGVLDALTELERAAQNKIDGLLTLSVPPDMIDEHLDLINIHTAIKEDIVAMRQAFEDPLRALVTTRQHQSNVAGLLNAFRNVRATLESRDIIYTDGEFGMFFFSLEP